MFDLRQLEHAQAIVGEAMPPTPAHVWPLLSERLGATVTGRLETDAVPIIEIPATALTRSNQQPAVWIVDPSSRTVSIRNIDVLRFEQANVVVSQGLDAGEVVVTAGVQALHPGQKIRLLGSEQ